MLLKKLQLYGFKSFPDKTDIVFEPGITCIVGPNGAGKSNIVDSIRWALGEQSVKSLRSPSMDNVIFNGTEGRKPLGMGEVSLVFSDFKGQLAFDFEELKVTRQIFRNSDCEYFINKNPCRMKDITNMFLDSGVGTDTYFILEQGKMDAILSSKPLERRYIFEEAAGVSKYKARKEEALKKLDQTDQNLQRIKDVLGEVRRQINSLERHAKKAEKYKKLAAELKDAEVTVAKYRYDGFRNNIDVQNIKKNGLKIEIDKTQNSITSEEGRLQEGRKNLLEEEKKLTLRHEEFYKVSNEINNVFNRISLLEDRKNSLTREIEQIKEKLEELDRKNEGIAEQIGNTKKEYEETVKGLFDEKENIGKQANTAKKLREKHRQNEKQLEELRVRMFDVMNEAVHLKNELKAAGNRLTELKFAKEKLGRKKNDFVLRKEVGDKRLLELKAELADIGGRKKLTSSADVYEYTAEEVKTIETIGNSISGDFERAEKEKELTSVRIIIKSLREQWGFYVKKVKPLFKILQDVKGTVAKKQEEQSLTEELVRVERELKVLEAEITELAKEEAALSKIKEELSTKSGTSEENRKENEEKIKALEAEVLVARKDEQTENEKFTDRKVRLTFLEQREINLKNELSRMGLNVDELEVNKSSYIKESGSKAEQLLGLGREVAVLQAFLKEIAPKKAALEKSLADEKVNNDKIRDSFYKDEEQLRTYRKDYEIKQKHLFELEIEINKEDLESKAVRDRIVRDYHVDVSQLALDKDYIKENSLTVDAADAKIKELRIAIEEMGSVNLDSMDEYQELTVRYNFLSGQEKDLIDAKNELLKTIQELNQTTKDLFMETFTKIKANFNEVFRKLFNGGHGDLQLMDENNILETGIEIIARPPGKRPLSVAMLSGGERAMTAIGLLFAVFMVKPSPFCILDEIDAPLDDSNVLRFRDMLKETFSHVQFIIITHNKLTMECADTLYGITQLEKGVSTVVSVKLKDIDPATGKVSAEAAKRRSAAS
ncbi:MAG: AAA family ATPase [Candidatus Firestonebacteria bacterium]|nr:AAA family ATPase [Candidatus Firestonebacteria bacterium]